MVTQDVGWTSLFSHLYNLGTGAHARSWDNASILGDGTGFDDGNIELVVLLVHRIPAIHEIDGEHAQVLIKELYVAVVDAFGNFLANLVGTPPLDHVEAGPSILRLGAGRSTDEEVVLELALQSILLDMVCKGGGHLSAEIENISSQYVGMQVWAGSRREELTWDTQLQ